MKGILKGKKVISFRSKQTGELIEGVAFHVEYEDTGVEGVACDNFFINSNRNIPELSVNTPIEFFYNKYGKIDVIFADNSLDEVEL